MDRITFQSPSLDISAGDGTLMFQHLGGEFGFDYDLYRETQARDFQHNNFIDIYDCDKNISPDIRKAPVQKFDFATDWKPELLKKAGRLNIYEKLISTITMNYLHLITNKCKRCLARLFTGLKIMSNYSTTSIACCGLVVVWQPLL